jgi:phospholipid-transporting ATPase
VQPPGEVVKALKDSWTGDFDGQGMKTGESYYKEQLKNEAFKGALNSKRDLVEWFLTSMAICNECLIETDEDGEINYTSPSPDEIALCQAAKQFRVKLISRKGKTLEVLSNGLPLKFEVEILFEFDSERKAQSVIIRDPRDDEYYMLVKGADSSIFKILSPSKDQVFIEETKSFLYNASIQGLRTLCFGIKRIKKEDFENIKSSYNDILIKPNRETNLRKLAKKVEINIVLMGATAIEDKLQPNVRETIKKFAEADIKVWMITGDKFETAENIALACGITSLDMSLFTLRNFTSENLQREIDNINKELEKIPVHQQRGLILEMSCMDFLFKNKGKEYDPVLTTLLENLGNMLVKMTSVVCCRATPKQKAKLVKLVRNKGFTTLAVGDGANDVNMINMANVGIGIYGQEG